MNAGHATVVDFPIRVAAVGTVQALNTVDVKVRVDGQLQRVAFSEGQDVKVGQLLAQLDQGPLTAQLRQAEAAQRKDEASLENAQLDLARYSKLVGIGAATSQTFDTAKAQVKVLGATVAADAALVQNDRLQLGFTTLTAPFTGRVGARSAAAGECDDADRIRRAGAGLARLYRQSGRSDDGPDQAEGVVREYGPQAVARRTRQCPCAGANGRPAHRRAEPGDRQYAGRNAGVHRGGRRQGPDARGADRRKRRRHDGNPQRHQGRRSDRVRRTKPPESGRARGGNDRWREGGGGGRRFRACGEYGCAVMSLLELFIQRRVATTFLAIAVLLVGIVAYFLLPVAPLPQVDFPTIQVVAKLPGASADTMATSVATPLERQLSNISGITQMTSSSSLGTTTIAIQFDLSRDINSAAQDVQTAINAAGGTLPKNLPNPPTYQKVNPADFTLLSLALTSPSLTLTQLDSYAEDFLAQQISQMPGVGLVDFHGQQRPAVRVRIDPDKLAARGLTLEDVRSIVSVQTVNAPKGSLNGPDRSVVFNATDQITTAAGYRDLVVAYKNGAPIRLQDLGTVIDAAEDTQQAAWLQHERAIILDIHKQPGYNVVSTIQNITAHLPALEASLPAAAHVHVVGDRTQTINASVHDVQFTLMLTIALVVMVFVVDDAIVVIENVMRHIEEGVPRMRAALLGAQEVRFTIISMTISLIAVFIPILMMGGIVGRLFREFAVTVSAAIVMSALVSLTVTPMLCGWLIRTPSANSGGPRRLERWFEAGFVAVERRYEHGLDWVLRHQKTMLAVTIATIVATGVLFVLIPKGFFPQEDSGLIQGVAQAAPDISPQSMAENRCSTV